MLCNTAVVVIGLGAIWSDWRPTTIGYIDNVDPAHPVRCHWEFPVDEDRCDAVLTYMTNAWINQVDEIGFAPPFPDDDGRVDVYLSNDQTGGGAYTYAYPEDLDPTDGRMGSAAYMVIDPVVPDDEMESYVAHEFNHVLQYAMDYAEPTLPMWEGVATAAQSWTMGYFDPYDASYIKDFQDIPWMGILGDGYIAWHDFSLWNYHEYGSVMWIRHLDHHYGDDAGSAAQAFWWAAVQPEMPNEPDVLDAYDAVTGDWHAALLDMSVERVWLGTELQPDGYGPNTPAMKLSVDRELSWDELPIGVVPVYGPFQTGSVYVTVSDVPAGTAVELTVSSKQPNDWAVLAVEGAEYSSAMGDTITWVAQGGTITFGALNYGLPSFDADHPLVQADIELQLQEGEVPPDDTGDTGVTDTEDTEDTGVPDTDTDPDPDTDGDTDPPLSDPDDEKSGGCSAAGPAAAALWPLALLALAPRRRRLSPRR